MMCAKPAGAARCRFGDPFARKNTFADVRDVLAGMGAKAGHYITQMVSVGLMGGKVEGVAGHLRWQAEVGR